MKIVLGNKISPRVRLFNLTHTKRESMADSSSTQLSRAISLAIREGANEANMPLREKVGLQDRRIGLLETSNAALIQEVRSLIVAIEKAKTAAASSRETVEYLTEKVSRLEKMVGGGSGGGGSAPPPTLRSLTRKTKNDDEDAADSMYGMEKPKSVVIWNDGRPNPGASSTSDPSRGRNQMAKDPLKEGSITIYPKGDSGVSIRMLRDVMGWIDRHQRYGGELDVYLYHLKEGDSDMLQPPTFVRTPANTQGLKMFVLLVADNGGAYMYNTPVDVFNIPTPTVPWRDVPLNESIVSYLKRR